MAHAYYGLWIRVSLILVLLRADCALAATNRTIDDADPQVTYSPNNQWSQGSTCSECLIKLDPSQTLDGTWHDTSHHTSDPAPRFMQVQFTGTAVYVFNVLANAVPGAATTTSLQFTLDGAEDGTFLHTPSDSPDPEFGVLVYARDGLDNVQHTLKMQAADTPDSVILFDFIAYTVPDESGPIDTTPPPSTITTITSTSLDLITTTTTDTTTSSTSTLSSSTSSDTWPTWPPPSSSTSSLSPASSTTRVPSPFTSPSSSSFSFPSSPLSTSSVTSSLPVRPPTTSLPSSSARSPTKPVGLIVGATIGGIGVVAFIATLILVLRRRASKDNPSFNVLETEKGNNGASDSNQSTTEYGTNQEQNVNQIPESGSSVLLIGNPEYPPSGSAGTPARLASWTSSTESSSYSYPPSSPMRVPSISDLYSAPTEVREAAIASSQLLLPSRPQSEGRTPTSPSMNHAIRALPPIPGPHEMNVSPTTPGTTYSSWDRTASTGNSSVYAQLAALQEEVEKMRLEQEAPPRYDQA